MISKERFVEVLKFIKERSESMELINSLMTKEFEDCIFQPYFKYETEMIRLLADAMEAPCALESIEYFVYELDFGKKWTRCCVTTLDGKEIPYGTAEDVYDDIVNSMNCTSREGPHEILDESK